MPAAIHQMTPENFPILVGSLVTFLLALGGGAKWLLSHIDAKAIKSALIEERARTELSTRLYEEIKVLREQVARMQVERNVYIRRIYQLETFIHSQPGIDIPTMSGWPPL